MKGRLAAIGLSSLFLVTCLPVPFDLSLSKAATLTGKMTQDNPKLIEAGDQPDSSMTDFTFFPSVLATGGFDYSAGFVVWVKDLNVTIGGVANGSRYASTSQPISNPDPHGQAVFAWPMKSGVSYLFGTSFDVLSPSSSGYGTFQGTPPGSFQMVSSGTSSGPYTNLLGTFNAVGASVTADPNLSYDKLHVLGQNGSSYVEANYQLNSGSWALTGATPRNGGSSYSLGFLPSGITHVMYYYDESSTRSYASWWDSTSGSWVSWVWWESTLGSGVFSSTPLPINHRIDALLTNGQLLSTEDGTGRLYDGMGNKLATFDLGNLVYIGEQYLGGIAWTYFSQCLIYNKTLHFNVYRIRTDQLPTLGG